MAKYSTKIKQKLIHIIKKMSGNPKDFVQNPEKDFTRNRKLSFESMVSFILAMNGNSLYKELMTYFNYDVTTASTSAFIQQRNKIRPDAFKHLFTRIIVVIILLLLPAILSFIITLINNNSTGEVTVGQDGNLYCDIVN